VKDLSTENLLQRLTTGDMLDDTIYELGTLTIGEYTSGLALLEGDDGMVEAAIEMTRSGLCAKLSGILEHVLRPDYLLNYKKTFFNKGVARAYFLLFIAWVNDHRGRSIVQANEREKPNNWLTADGVAELLAELYRPTDERGYFSRQAWKAAKPIKGRPLVENALAFWDQLDLKGVSFWEFGTTSYVLKVRSSNLPDDLDDEHNQHVALKCLDFRFGTHESHIRIEAENSAAIFEEKPQLVEQMPAVYASTPKWIAMEFIQGPTLAEWVEKWKAACSLESMVSRKRLRRPSKGQGHNDDSAVTFWPGAKVVDSLGSCLASVIDGLHKNGLTHGDLQPRNIIVCGTRSALLPSETKSAFDKEGNFAALGPEVRLRLLDRGRNFASLKLVTAADLDYTWFEPPESDQPVVERPATTGASVRAAPPQDPFALTIASQPHPAHDFFALGRLIEYLLEGERFEGRELIPLSIYARFPLVARLLDDLLDPEPSNRLLLTSEGKGEFERLEGFAEVLQESVRTEEKLGIVSRRRPPTDSPTFDKWAERYQELLGKFGFRDISFRLVVELFRRSDQEPGSKRPIDWLAVFALTSALGFALCLMVTLGGLAADYGHHSSVPGLNTSLSFLGSVTVGYLFRPGAPIGHTVHNNPAHFVGFSYAVAGFGYYQIVFAAAASNMRRASGKVSRFFRVFMRAWCLLPTAIIVIANLLWPQLWLYFSAIGVGLVCAMNFSCAHFERRAWNRILDQLKGPEAPANAVRPMTWEKMSKESRVYVHHEGDFLANWKVSSLGYCIATLGLAVGVTTHRLHDIVLYEAVIVGANLLLLYHNAIVIFGPQLRGRLSRAFVLEERADLVDCHGLSKLGVGT
jgi:serine/threonine protein kinase